MPSGKRLNTHALLAYVCAYFAISQWAFFSRWRAECVRVRGLRPIPLNASRISFGAAVPWRA